MPIFDDRTLGLLRKPLSPDDPRGKVDRDGHPYLPGIEIKATLNEVFGFDGWSYQVKDLVLISERVIEKEDRKKKDSEGRPLRYRLHELQYNATVRLEVYGLSDSSGRNSVVREDVGNQIAYCSDLLPPPHSLAAKGAVTSALKRAAASLGAQFGLTLLRDDPFGDMPLYADEAQEPETRKAAPPPPRRREEERTAAAPPPQEQGDTGGDAQPETAGQRSDSSAASGSTSTPEADRAQTSDAEPPASPAPPPPTTDELVRDEQQEQADDSDDGQADATAPTADDVADAIRAYKDKRGKYPAVVEQHKLTRSMLQAMEPGKLQAIMDSIQRESLAR